MMLRQLILIALLVFILGLTMSINAMPMFGSEMGEPYAYYRSRRFDEPRDKKVVLFGLFPTSNSQADNEDTLRFGR